MLSYISLKIYTNFGTLLTNTPFRFIRPYYSYIFAQSIIIF